MTEPARPTADHQPTGADVLRWYNARAVHVGAAAETMAIDLAAAWAEVEEVRGELEAVLQWAAGTVSRGYVRTPLPTQCGLMYQPHSTVGTGG